MNSEESERSQHGDQIDGAPPGPKTDRDHLMKDNLQSTGDLS